MRKISQAALLAATLGLPALYGATAWPALAEDTKDSHTGAAVSAPDSSPSADESSATPDDDTPFDAAASFTAKVEIQSVAAVDSSMDEGAIRDALGPNFLKHTDALAHLNATSITIPEIDLTTTSTTAAGTTQTKGAYKDIVLSDVKNGMVGTMAIGSASSTSTTGNDAPATFAYQSFSYANVDIDALFGFLGLVQGDAGGAMQPGIGHAEFAGGTYQGSDVSCSFGKYAGDVLTVKPSPIAFTDASAAFDQLKAAKGADEPPAAAIGTLVKYVAALLRDFATSPGHFDGLSCNGTSESKAYSFSLGAVDIGNFAGAIYPEIAFHDVKVDGGEQGKFSLDAATLKGFDLNPPLDALLSADPLNKSWFDANGRRLVPSWAGLSLTGLSLDVPDPDSEGARLTASVHDFDLTLSDYLNGIPTKISTKSSGIDVPLPPNSTDDTLKMLEALGLSRVNLGFELSAAWDKASQSISVDKFAVSGADLGSAAVAVGIGSATDQLFDTSSDTMHAAAMALTLKSVKVDVTDAGIGGKFAAQLASEQSADPAALRTQLAGTAEAVVLQMLGATPTAQALASAVGGFVTGSAKSVSVTMTSKDPSGLPWPLLMKASDDPTVLTNAVDITGSAQ